MVEGMFVGGCILVGGTELGTALESTGEEGFLVISELGRGLDINHTIIHGGRRIQVTMIRRLIHVLRHVGGFVRGLGLV
jgi:hypothetical protein